MSLKDQSTKNAAERIGIKVRHLRNSRGLTQKELAGDLISRNMLSMIESGAALPSIESLIHISDTLRVPTGYFFAEADEEIMYAKKDVLASVYRLLEEKRYNEAAALCEPYSDNDAEMRLYFSMCHLQCAISLLERSMLASAEEHILHAKAASANLPLCGDYISNVCDFIRILSESVAEDDIPDIPIESTGMIPAPIVSYIAAYKAVKNGDPECADAIARSGILGRFHSLHIRGAALMVSGDYDGATRLFDLALTLDDGGFYSRYKLVCDLEICRKNAGDFEAAYSLSTSRMEMLGMFSR